MFLLDTNVISELRKVGDGKADANVVAWLSSVDATTFYLSAVTLMEIELGILRIERRDPAQGARLRAWMDHHVLPEFAERTLPVDTAVGLRCAPLHVPDTCHERDAFIAATALAHGMTVVTRNLADFAPTGVPLLNPWEAPHERKH
ncbi:VapC toxin protein [Candidatus Burkholderia verschuerenii]|uniref:VapC toxin protein n=1 Tax=Candidatus Burkholderia verschuerenii TaxID=242163 RepID=A0A0L0MGV6_9BURK|nr:type II toxin-antitoxin system VapC family toxin [Candidatus Burkholderia verschuerenii]KND61531.1 VapC toxin protein [Candidatus Burkholderia verschuerenii]